jgi:hypothetical protein
MWGTFAYQPAWLQANKARHLPTDEVFGDPEAVAPTSGRGGGDAVLDQFGQHWHPRVS